MPRVKRGVMTHKRHKRILKKASGYWGRRHKIFKTAKEAVMKAQDDAFTGRKQKKRDFRALWIARINAGCRQNGMTYNRFIDGLNKACIAINRKALSEIAIHDPQAFKELTEKARAAITA
ncbi:MAG: 50S ribosomal protein L20 [Armatimonadota bacterium]